MICETFFCEWSKAEATEKQSWDDLEYQEEKKCDRKAGSCGNIVGQKDM